MNKEEYIIKINDNEISVSKDLYNILVPLGKIINRLEQENKQLKENWNKLKDKIKPQLSNKTFEDRIMSIVLKNILKIMQELENGDSNE